MIEQITDADAQDSLLDLVERLTAPKDRRRFAELISWVRSMPQEDDVVKFCLLIGYLQLIGATLPAELQSCRAAVVKLQRELQERLDQLPEHISAKVNAEELADKVAGNIYDRLAEMGVNDDLQDFVADVKEASETLDSLIGPVRQKSREVAVSLESQLGGLQRAAASVQQSLYAMRAETRKTSRALTILLVVSALIFGFASGMAVEQFAIGSKKFTQNQGRQEADAGPINSRQRATRADAIREHLAKTKDADAFPTKWVTSGGFKWWDKVTPLFRESFDEKL